MAPQTEETGNNDDAGAGDADDADDAPLPSVPRREVSAEDLESEARPRKKYDSC